MCPGVPLWFAIGYFSGAIPFGYLVVKWKRGIDIRSAGSGNIGATNVYRILGIKWGIITFILDALKGFAPLFAAKFYLPAPQIYIVALSPFVGHCYTLFLKGKGGKGVATSAGILLAIAPFSFVASLIIWLLVVLIFKVSSIGALSAAVFLPVFTHLIYHHKQLTVFVTLLALWVIVRHSDNIKRLKKGEEETKKIE